MNTGINRKIWAMAFTFGVFGCGVDPGQETSSHFLDKAPDEVIATVGVRPLDPGLRTDEDIMVSNVDGWIDLMPGIHHLGGPHTRAQVTFTAMNFGCTKAEDFRAKFTLVDGKQILTVRRIRRDTCNESPHPIDLKVSVYGEYQPAVPVFVNGLPFTAEERIIY